MGRKDIVTKEYIRRPEIFADIFNYRLYNGKDRIQPEQLAEENITENLVLEREEHGKQKRIKLEAVEKYRDVKKVFRDGSYRCLLFGVEEQDSVHYAMPVREFVYDAMAYEHQIREISRTHRKEKDYKEHGKEEFLSGFYRNDRILPVITLVLYFGTAPWDGPRSLKEMMRWTGEEAEKYIQDYQLNLIIPAEMEDEEIEKLQSSLREVFYFLKYAGDWKKLEKILTDDERFQRLETEAATVIRELTNTEIEIKEEQEEQNMCKAIEQMKENERKIGLKIGLEDGKRIGLEDGKRIGLEDGKRIGLEDGKRIGLEDGKRIGRELGEAEIILRMYQKGYGSEQIAEMTDMEEERVKAIICMKLEIK